MASLGECDSCARGPRLLRLVNAYGMDCCACSECRGGSLSDDIDELEDRIDDCPNASDRAEIEAALTEARIEQENG